MSDHEAPILNVMIEDYLARAQTEFDRESMLMAWIMLGSEYMARTTGRSSTVHKLIGLKEFIERSSPSNPWKA